MSNRRIGLNAHLASAKPGYRRAGVSGYIANIIERLPAAAPDLQLVAFAGRETPLPQGLTVRRTRLPTHRPLWRIFWEQALAPWAARAAGLSLFHAMAFVAPALTPCPFVVTVYDLSFLREPERLSRARRFYLSRFTRPSCRRAAHVIAISASAKSETQALLNVPGERISVIYPGVDPGLGPVEPAQVEAFRRRRGLPDRFILALGTLEPRKNLVTLIRAYAALPAELRARVGLALVGGNGWLYKDIIAAIEELGLAGQVMTPGYAPQDELALWYSAATVLAYPSLYEGFGIPIVEAMRCGAPVIASDSSSLPEAVGAAGLLLPPRDEAAWTETLVRVLGDAALREELRARGLAHSRQFTWERAAQQTAEVYRRVLGLAA